MKSLFFRVLIVILLTITVSFIVFYFTLIEPHAISHYWPGGIIALIVFSICMALYMTRQITVPLKYLIELTEKFPHKSIPLSGYSRIPEFNNMMQVFSSFMVNMKLQLKDLELEKELHRSLLDGLKEGVIGLDRDGTVIFQNEALQQELFLPGGTGKPYFKAIQNPEILEFVQKTLQKTGDSENAEMEFQKGSMYFQLSCYPVLLGKNPHIYLLIVQDKTDEYNTRRMREDFLQNASHELKTPITSIRGYAETILYKTNDEQSRKFLEAIIRNVARMELLIEDMVIISTVQSGAFPFHPQNIDIGEILNEILHLVDGALKSKDQNIEIVSETDSPLYADPLLLEHLFINLITNASRYSPENTNITIRILQSQNQELIFEIEDEGPGIPPQYREKIFERFFRVDRNRSRSEGGTGLGLSIVRQIVRIHGGDIHVKNGRNGGSLFRFSLPAKNIHK